MKKKVCVIGLGYVGLPMAIAISNAGHHESDSFSLYPDAERKL